MGKNDKKQQKKVEEEEEEVKLSKKEALNKKYSHVDGENKDFIVRILGRVEKAPRVRSSFQKIIDAVNTKRKELQTPDPRLDKLEEQLTNFMGKEQTGKSLVANPQDFQNYENKFVYEP